MMSRRCRAGRAGVPLLLAGWRAPEVLRTMDLRIATWNLEHPNDTEEPGGERALEVRAWADRREANGTAFGILGDFNRRLG